MTVSIFPDKDNDVSTLPTPLVARLKAHETKRNPRQEAKYHETIVLSLCLRSLVDR